MIIKNGSLEIKPSWNRSESNRWADYIELLCLKNGLVSIDDIIDILTDGEFDNSTDKGEQEHSRKIDRIIMDCEEYYRLLESRELVLNEYYPFSVVDGNLLILNENISFNNMIYFFLLLSSSICFMENTVYHTYTTSFEQLSKLLLEILSPCGAIVEIFGTSRQAGMFSGTLRERVEKLAECIGTETSKKFDRNPKFDNIHGGDGGIDIVSFMTIDNAGFVPFSFSQCTCSYKEWEDKQRSISEERWKSWLELTTHYAEYMFVPFSCRNSHGKFYDETSINSFLIDRIRVIELLERYIQEKSVLDKYGDWDLNSVFV